MTLRSISLLFGGALLALAVGCAQAPQNANTNASASADAAKSCCKEKGDTAKSVNASVESECAAKTGCSESAKAEGTINAAATKASCSDAKAKECTDTKGTVNVSAEGECPFQKASTCTEKSEAPAAVINATVTKTGSSSCSTAKKSCDTQQP